ncbi:MAG: AAA family ATPase, partial [Synechococcaceae cyanobacterium]|nr:AAA family ATPase [Synechococcaceae cyanobacterium]
KGRPASIATLHLLAQRYGYREPRRQRRSTQGAQGDRQQRKPAGFTPRPATKVRWGKRELSHTRRMQCLERCVLVQAARERNSLRRRATLLRVARALGLHQIVNRQEIAQRVLEAKDQQQGNRYKALSAADRLAMPRPMVRFLLPGLLPANDLTILGGLAKVGKTRLAIAIVNAVLRGLAVLDMPAPTHTAPVVLVTDDQADGDTADMLQALDLWSHPGLTWSPNFRLTEADVDALLETIKANPGALVVLDSLRSISRNLQHGENDPEIGATLYDLKQAVIDSGGTVLLIHHCSKAAELVGVEALSGHNAIAGAANTVLTMHYLPGENGRPNKSSPERRLFREPRSGEGFDLVISRDGDSGGFRKVCSLSEWQQQAQEAKAASKRERLTPMQQQALEALQDADGDWLTRRQVVEALGLSWGDRGRNQDARRVEDALRRLVELQAAESQRAGTGATYRATCEAHRTTRTSVPTSGAKGSELSDENPDNPDNPDNQSPQGWPACPGVSGNRPDTENRCHNRLSGLSGLSDAPPAPPGTPKYDSAGDPWCVGSGADAYGDGDDPAWGPRREAA